MRWVRSLRGSLRWRLALAMLLVFALGLATSVILSTQETLQEEAIGLREEVFERFRKAAPSSPGAGLGLAIVRQVARAHGGEARVRPGPGCRVEIALPARG